jgi:hypothetical protein
MDHCIRKNFHEGIHKVNPLFDCGTRHRPSRPIGSCVVPDEFLVGLSICLRSWCLLLRRVSPLGIIWEQWVRHKGVLSHRGVANSQQEPDPAAWLGLDRPWRPFQKHITFGHFRCVSAYRLWETNESSPYELASISWLTWTFGRGRYWSDHGANCQSTASKIRRAGYFRTMPADWICVGRASSWRMAVWRTRKRSAYHWSPSKSGDQQSICSSVLFSCLNTQSETTKKGRVLIY